MLRGQPRFRVDLGMMEGRRIVRHFEKKSDAERYLQRARMLLLRQGTAGFKLSDSQRHDAELSLGVLEKNGVQATLLDAVSFFVRYAQPSSEEKSVEEVIAELVENKKKTGKSEEYVKDIAWSLARFQPDFEGRKISTILTQEVEKHIDRRKLPTTSCRNYIRDLNIFFNYCVRRKYCPENPVKAIEKPAAEEKPVEILTVEQCRTLLNTASTPKYREILPSIAIGLFAGLRMIEIRRLDWSEVDVARRIIEIKAAKAKTRQRRIVDMSENLAAWLSLDVHPSSGLVAPKGVRWRKKFEPLLDEAKIRPWPRNALRHSFGSYHLALSKDPSKTAFQMGHGDTQMLFRHYRELVSPEAAAQYWALLPEVVYS